MNPAGKVRCDMANQIRLANHNCNFHRLKARVLLLSTPVMTHSVCVVASPGPPQKQALGGSGAYCPTVASSRKSRLGFQKEKPRRSGAKGICGSRVFGLPQRGNSERGDWFHKRKAQPGDGAKGRNWGPSCNKPHPFTFASQHVGIGAAVGGFWGLGYDALSPARCAKPRPALRLTTGRVGGPRDKKPRLSRGFSCQWRNPTRRDSAPGGTTYDGRYRRCPSIKQRRQLHTLW